MFGFAGGEGASARQPRCAHREPLRCQEREDERECDDERDDGAADAERTDLVLPAAEPVPSARLADAKGNHDGDDDGGNVGGTDRRDEGEEQLGRVAGVVVGTPPREPACVRIGAVVVDVLGPAHASSVLLGREPAVRCRVVDDGACG